MRKPLLAAKSDCTNKGFITSVLTQMLLVGH